MNVVLRRRTVVSLSVVFGGARRCDRALLLVDHLVRHRDGSQDALLEVPDVSVDEVVPLGLAMFGLPLGLLWQRDFRLGSAKHGLRLLKGLDLIRAALLAETPANLRFVTSLTLFASLRRSRRLFYDWLVQFEGLTSGVVEICALSYVGYSHVCHGFTVELLGDVHLHIIVDWRVLMDVLLHASRIER